MPYDKYPAVNESYEFPAVVRHALANSPEIATVIANTPGPSLGIQIKGILDPGEVPTEPGVWARRLP